MRQYLKEIIYLLGNEKNKIPIMVILFLGVSLLDLIGISLIGPYISLLIDHEGKSGKLMELVGYFFGYDKSLQELTNILGVVLVVSFLIRAIIAIVIHYLIVRFSQNKQSELRRFLMKSYQSMPYSTYLCRNSSEYVYSIQILVERYGSSVLQPGLRMLADGMVVIVIAALLAVTNITALLILLVILGVIMFGYDRVFRHKLREYGVQLNQISTHMIKTVNEAIDGFKEIRILNKEGFFYQTIVSDAKKYADLQVALQTISAAPRYLLEFLLIVFVVLSVVVLTWLQYDPKEFIPTIGVFGIAALRLMPAANLLSISIAQLRVSRDGVSLLYNDVKQLKNKTYTNNFNPNLVQVSHNAFKKVSLHNVSFQYNEHQAILREVTLDISAGESIGIIGKSGSGKTTLINVLLGLLSPQQGSIHYNDKPIEMIMNEWHSHIAYIPQQNFLIDDTLSKNIILGDSSEEEIDEMRLYNVLKQAQLDEFVNQLPKGVDTVIGERGVSLSGGQRQRLALARAFYNDRRVLILDEATSALDHETENEVMDEFVSLKGKVTMVIISHRMSTVQYCDRIYEVKDGCVTKLSRRSVCSE